MINRLIWCICIATIVMFCYACNPLFKKNSELWFYTYNMSGKENRDSTLTPASFIYLQTDGSYTCDLDAFDYGHWIKNGNQLVLTNMNNQPTTILIQSEDLTEMQLQIGKTVADFEAQPSSFTSNENNPFSLENNRWRIQPKQKETEQQIKERLKNHCKFWEEYFKWALGNGISSVDVRSTPTCLKVYGNGLSIKPYKDLPVKWQSYFYDSSDCQHANDVLKDIFEQRNIAWAHTNNKYKMFISAFQQIEGYLK